MSEVLAGIVGFDITPDIHPEHGAWGTTPSITEIDLPLLSRCVALKQGDKILLWFGSDLVGEMVEGTDELRDMVADAVGLTRDQVIWSTSQTHSSGAMPGSKISGSTVTQLAERDPAYCEQQYRRFCNAFKDAAAEAIQRLEPVDVWAGRGYCDSMSYNTRLPMPTGGVKFSRHHMEGLQSGKFFDPTVALVRFDDKQGNALGAILNFCAHPATMIMNKYLSPDWVGTARQYVEDAIGGRPAMFVQGFCGDVNCHHIFGSPKLAKRNGQRLGEAAAETMRHLIPARPAPLQFVWETTQIQCRPMYSCAELDQQLTERRAFIEELDHDPQATWFCGVNFPEKFSAEDHKAGVQLQIDYLEEGLRMLESDRSPCTTMDLTLGAVRIGDVAAVLSPGENFTLTGHRIRLRSPFVHTLICGDTNGLFGYMGTDDEIDRGGYETDSFWKYQLQDGFRLAPAKGLSDNIVNTSLDLLTKAASL